MDQIDRIRAFNRDYTRRIGVLNRRFLGTDYTLAELRILHDIDAHSGKLTARGLSRSLGLDEGHVSRLVARFESRGLIRRIPDPADARRRLLEPTSEGRDALVPIRAIARDAVAESIAHLDATGRADLVAAMERVRFLLDPEGEARQNLRTEDVTLRDFQTGDAAWIVGRHAELYTVTHGFDVGFEAFVARIVADHLLSAEPDREHGWIAEGPDGARLGCILCTAGDAETALLRILLVDPAARGLGLGRRLVEACLAFARQSGYRRLRLTTHQSLGPARALYAAAGLSRTEATPTRAFGQPAVEETWEIDFRQGSGLAHAPSTE